MIYEISFLLFSATKFPKSLSPFLAPPAATTPSRCTCKIKGEEEDKNNTFCSKRVEKEAAAAERVQSLQSHGIVVCKFGRSIETYI
jgi:hypothetical protein